MAERTRDPPKENLVLLDQGREIIRAHPLFGRLTGLAQHSPTRHGDFPKDGWLRIIVTQSPTWDRSGTEYRFALEANGWRRAEAAEWANVLGQALLHIVMSHTDPGRNMPAWRIAADLEATELLRHLSIGQRPPDLPYLDVARPGRTTAAIAAALEREGEAEMARYRGGGLAGAGQPAWLFPEAIPSFSATFKAANVNRLGAAIRSAIVAAVETAGTAARGPGTVKRNPNSMAERARSWFIASYPLLAALAAAFEIVEDAALCDTLDIRIAAVEPEARRIYVNPKFPWTVDGMRFVMAHELLHVGLSHAARRQGRDPYLWNVACDYVINGWLLEMGVGTPPTDDLLLDPELGLERESAEAIYDRIVRDLRLMKRLQRFVTPRGTGKPDILGERAAGWWTGPGCDLDTFYRRALMDGLDLHVRSGRGTLPGDMVDEVRALMQPPIPWDVKLGQWLDMFFPPLERKRTYARASRRQSATPDIPRPVYVRPEERLATRTFGVVVDTSGSMAMALLARAFGAIASYAMSREVPLVRIVQSDAGIHDMGYVEAERLLERIEVKGRGGTVLGPAVAHLQRAADFPKDAPILVITDGLCDTFTVSRDHAFLMPMGRRLPFRTHAPVFHFEPDA